MLLVLFDNPSTELLCSLSCFYPVVYLSFIFRSYFYFYMSENKRQHSLLPCKKQILCIAYIITTCRLHLAHTVNSPFITITPDTRHPQIMYFQNLSHAAPNAPSNIQDQKSGQMSLKRTRKLRLRNPSQENSKNIF